MNTKAITVRFHPDNEFERRAWEKVLRKCRSDNLSLGQAVISLLNESSVSGLTQAQQEAVAGQITSGVMAELQKTLPSFIAGYIAGSGAAAPVNNTVAPVSNNHETASTENTTPDFRRSRVNRSFAGG